jgi:hypothetical protein
VGNRGRVILQKILMREMNWSKFLTASFLTLFFTQCSTEVPPPKAEALLPVSAPLLLKVGDIDAWSAFADTSQWALLNSPVLNEISKLSPKKWSGALATSGANRMDWIWTTDKDLKISESFIATDYNNTPIYRIDSLYAFSASGVWALSERLGLIQDAVNQWKSGISLLDDPAFSKLWQNASHGDVANVFIKHKGINEVGTLFFDENWDWVSQLATWSEVDVVLKKNKILLTSASLVADSSTTFLGTFDERSVHENGQTHRLAPQIQPVPGEKAAPQTSDEYPSSSRLGRNGNR